MNQLKDIQANVDANVTNLLEMGGTERDVLINFELKLERAQDIMRQVKNALNLDHALRAELISVEQAIVLKSAIEYIIRNTNHLINDLNNINGSGIHEVIEPTRFTLIIASILETADQRYVGESLWRIVKNKFKKLNHFSDQFKAKPNGKAYDLEEEDEISKIPTFIDIGAARALVQQA